MKTMNQELAAGSTLSHYRILSKLGAGGMGEVYVAQDTKLERKVALKILPADLASNRDQRDDFEYLSDGRSETPHRQFVAAAGSKC